MVGGELTDLQIQQRIVNYGEVLRALRALKRGDFAFRMSTESAASGGEIAELFNDIVDLNVAMATQLARICDQASADGQVRQRVKIPGASGAWAQNLGSINTLLDVLAGQTSDALSKKQQEDLQRTNEQLKEKAGQLSEQMKQVEYKNKEIEAARKALEQKAEQLVLSSRYKSEFLANMSHELRTPLNSLLILAQLLAENAVGNLTPKQVEYAQTICISGNDLLAVINDILDLSKIESGTVTLNISTESLPELREYVERAFRQVAHDRGLAFGITMDERLPAAIRTDIKRLRQILQNLLSNAFKFTLQGAVSFQISMANGDCMRRQSNFDHAQEVMAFSVIDTGIGIAQDKQQIIFEAFRQADGTTSRQFEGTGLGLSISSELARLLGGEIQVESSPAEGSTFTLYLPLAYNPAEGDSAAAGTASEDNEVVRRADHAIVRQKLTASISAGEALDQVDDRDRIRHGDRVVLVVVDDAQLAAQLLRQVRELGFKGLRAANAHTALALANEYMPNVVTVDIRDQNTGGCAILNLLRQDPDTRHIPVYMISADEHQRTFACMCALGVLNTPSREETLREALRNLSHMGHDPKTLLVVAGSKVQRERMVGAIARDGLQVTSVSTGKQALKVLSKGDINCAVIGQSLGNMADLLREMVQTHGIEQVFIVVYTTVYTTVGRSSGRGLGDIQELAEILWFKRAKSLAAVLEETALGLHRAMKEMPPGHRRPLPSMRRIVPALAGRSVLIVDDDIRNIFALTGALEHQGMRVLNAESGPDGISMIEANPDIDVILMDIMMPEQDGYETIRVIRGLERFQAIPIIGVTAKAMKGDREKCIEAGATDYIAKPIDVEKLLSLMRMWIAG